MAQQDRRNDRGVAAVEFALVLPLLLLLIMGIVDFGVRFQQSAMVNNAAIIAARDMSINNNVAHATTAALNGGAPAGSTIAVTPGVCPTDGNVTVTITATQPTITGAFGANFTMRGKGVAKCTT